MNHRSAVVAAIAAAAAIAAIAPARADPPDEAAEGMARLTAAIRARDAAAIARQLAPGLVNAGVFTEPACAKRFPAGDAALPAGDVAAFARCLARLKLQPSTRHSALAEGAVLTFAPGVEVELVFDGSKLRWIGFLAQNGAHDGVPTLTVQAFEALRKAGTTRLDDALRDKAAPLAARTGSISAWIKLCLDATGAVVSATAPAVTGPDGTAALFLAAIGDWKFRPFGPRAAAIPVCSLSLLTYPAAAAPDVETLPLAVAPANSDD